MSAAQRALRSSVNERVGVPHYDAIPASLPAFYGNVTRSAAVPHRYAHTSKSCFPTSSQATSNRVVYSTRRWSQRRTGRLSRDERARGDQVHGETLIDMWTERKLCFTGKRYTISDK